ncbi:SurA N-terminal domain-containing protein [Neisseria leonii]|uniref:SurA N-terminal domain-containing protein n=1 Tax=Neisseria leonii TaxID=2995413 RepID=UPI00237A5CB6|nr:SurA N-terminal domain-containing protein [Neisseria sp. 3986]MDD9325531.1 SurA N-terminal domain-containing protein [Neisseria sp. 3986]
MFASVEKYSGPAKVLLGLIALTFVGFGVSTVAAPGSDYVVKVGDSKISQQDVQQALRNAQSGGQAADLTEDSVFQGLVQRAYLIEGAKDLGITVSLDQIKQTIVDEPFFHDEQGRFSQEKLNQYLASAGLSEDQLVEDIRRQFMLQNLTNLMQAGNLVSDAQAKQLVNLMQAERTVRSASFDPRAYLAAVKTDDAALKAYYEAEKANYTLPQAVKFEYVSLSLADLAAKQQVSEEEAKKAFEAQNSSGAGKKQVAHIMLNLPADAAEAAKVRAEAEQLLEQLKAQPARFAELARTKSQDEGSAATGGSLGAVGKDSPLPEDFKNAVLKLNSGDIALVPSSGALHIVKIEGAAAADFAQERAGLIEQLKRQKAQQQFAQAREKLAEEAFNGNDNLAVVAQKMGLKLEKNDVWLSRSEALKLGMPEALAAALFSEESLKNRRNSEPVNIGNDTVQVVRVSDVRQEKQVPYEEVKEDVRAAYVMAQAQKNAQEKAEQALLDLKGGEAVKLPWSPVEKLSADKAREVLPPQAFNELIKARPKDGKPAYVLLSDLPVPVLVEVQAVTLPGNTQAGLPDAKMLLQQRESDSVFNRVSAYWQAKIKKEQGAQKLGS